MTDTLREFGIINKMRILAENGAALSAICDYLRSDKIDAKGYILVLVKRAFLLDIPVVSPIGGWKRYGSGPFSDEDMDRMIMPEILRNKDRWEAEIFPD